MGWVGRINGQNIVRDIEPTKYAVLDHGIEALRPTSIAK